MNITTALIFALLVLAFSSAFAAEETSTFKMGNAEVVYNYEQTESGVAIFTLIALVAETNNSLRGLKNTDRRRLSKLGQLIYQCKLMLYKPAVKGLAADTKDPILISKNYSLFTDVDLSLNADERVGIQVQALQLVDDNSLFASSLGMGNAHKDIWETVGEDAAINLKQFNVNVLKETELIETSESLDITVRFPIFQMEKPVRQWSYNFSLRDFKQAIQHIDDNCTAVKLKALIKQKT